MCCSGSQGVLEITLVCCIFLVALPIDVYSYNGSFASFFEIPEPVGNVDEAALFRGVVACFQSLEARHLALKEVKPGTFVKANGVQVCALSPYCPVVQDLGGNLLKKNLKDIAKSKLFKSRRFRSAFRESRNIQALLKHPAMWKPCEDSALLFHFMAVAPNSIIKLNRMIRRKDGKPNWAIEKAVIDDITKRDGTLAYDTSDYRELVRYAGIRWLTTGNATKNCVNYLNPISRV